MVTLSSFVFRMLTEKLGLLFVGQYDQPFASIKYTKYLKELDGKIIECKFENNSWIFMRERTDKSFPNSHNTAMGTSWLVCILNFTLLNKQKIHKFQLFARVFNILLQLSIYYTLLQNVDSVVSLKLCRHLVQELADNFFFK